MGRAEYINDDGVINLADFRLSPNQSKCSTFSCVTLKEFGPPFNFHFLSYLLPKKLRKSKSVNPLEDRSL